MMAKKSPQKVGQGARSVFDKTDAPAPKPRPARRRQPKAAQNPEPSRPRGRPRSKEAWEKVTVVLYERQILFLDRLTVDLRAKSGAKIKRAEVIRALVDALERGDVPATIMDQVLRDHETASEAP
jgi:hypothetical protein